MKNWFNKTFKKSKVVCARVRLENRRMIERWVIPVADQIELLGIGTFEINNEDFVLTRKNIPTYHYDYDNPQPLPMLHGVKLSPKTPLQYQKALRNNVVEKLQEVMKPQLLDMKTLIIIGVNLLGLVAVYYMLNQNIVIILEKLTAMGF